MLFNEVQLKILDTTEKVAVHDKRKGVVGIWFCPNKSKKKKKCKNKNALQCTYQKTPLAS